MQNDFQAQFLKQATEVQLPPEKKSPNKTLILVAGLILVAIVAVFAVGSALQLRVKESDYGEWNNTVVLSPTLEDILSGDFSTPAYMALSSAFDEYFIARYPAGVGLSLANYEGFGEEDDVYRLKLISSRGEIFDVSASLNEDFTVLSVSIDGKEAQYPVESRKENEDDSGDDDNAEWLSQNQHYLDELEAINAE